jgi:hypothetical protein
VKPPRSAKRLPRYVRRKPLSGGRWGYFFEPPTWARMSGCPIKAEPLGDDYDAAVLRAENVLLKAFDSWRTGGLVDMVPIGPTVGTFDWLVFVFKRHQAWADIDRKTQRLYEQGLSLFASHRLKDGARAGSKKITDFTRGFVDAVYQKLLVVEEKNAAGIVVRRERRRCANAAMTACRRAWFVGQRAEEKLVPEINPFAKMGLKKRRPARRDGRRQPPHGANLLLSEPRRRSLATVRWRPQRLPVGSGCNARNTSLALSSSHTIGRASARTPYAWSIRKTAKTLGGRSLTRRNHTPTIIRYFLS